MLTISRNWIPITLCCIPVVAITAIVGLGILIGGVSFGGPLSLGVVMLALLVCPLHMGWMIWRMQRPQGASGNPATLAVCCPPETEEQAIGNESDLAIKLQRLHTKPEAVECM